MEKIECDLELSKFIYVAPTCLFLAPFLSKVIVSSELFVYSSVKPSTYTLFEIPSLTAK